MSSSQTGRRPWALTEPSFLGPVIQSELELQWPLPFQHDTLLPTSSCYFSCFILTSNYWFTEQPLETNSVLKISKYNYTVPNTSSLWLLFQSLNLYEKNKLHSRGLTWYFFRYQSYICIKHLPTVLSFSSHSKRWTVSKMSGDHVNGLS